MDLFPVFLLWSLDEVRPSNLEHHRFDQYTVYWISVFIRCGNIFKDVLVDFGMNRVAFLRGEFILTWPSAGADGRQCLQTCPFPRHSRCVNTKKIGTPFGRKKCIFKFSKPSWHLIRHCHQFLGTRLDLFSQKLLDEHSMSIRLVKASDYG